MCLLLVSLPRFNPIFLIPSESFLKRHAIALFKANFLKEVRVLYVISTITAQC